MSQETFTFQTEVSRLLDIVAGSLYSNREIFLRELISNASDACDKVRYLALSDNALVEEDAVYKVTLSVDADAGTLSIADNGIGLDRDDLIATLGTIASSGTGAFMDKMSGDKDKDLALIGQFGVGFYSAFMVADKVTVSTRKAGDTQAWSWESDGKGSFTIDEGNRDGRGTTIVLHMKDDAKEFLESARIANVVKTYSDHIGLPIEMDGETLNAASALWTLPAKDITPEQYTEFYHHVAHAADEPYLTLHNTVEGVVSYSNLLYIPSVQPYDLYDPSRKSAVKLYVNRVFITDNADGLMPSWLRFMKGVVDTPDISLNISREMLQLDPKLAKIGSGIVKKVLTNLKKKATKDPEGFAPFWGSFGAVIKEGLYEDFTHRDSLLELAHFQTTGEPALTTLKDYVARMAETQEAIYYIIAESPAQAARSPQLEGFKAKGIEVLLLSDPIDDFWIPNVPDFDGKPLRSVTQGGSDLDKLDAEAKDEETKKAEEDNVSDLITAFKTALGADVEDVRVSTRLTDSAVCLVAGESGLDMNLQKILKRHGQLTMPQAPVLEINPTHALIEKLAKRAKDAPGVDAYVTDAAYLLLDQARISEGEHPADPVAFAQRMAKVMELGA